MNKNKSWLMRFFDALYKIRVVPYFIGVVATGVLIFDIASKILPVQLSTVFQILWCCWAGATVGVDFAIGKNDWGV